MRGGSTRYVLKEVKILRFMHQHSDEGHLFHTRDKVVGSLQEEAIVCRLKAQREAILAT